MRSADLTQATLYRRVGAPSVPISSEYLCLYRYPSEAAIAAFEASAAKELARQVMQAGWEQQGIEAGRQPLSCCLPGRRELLRVVHQPKVCRRATTSQAPRMNGGAASALWPAWWGSPVTDGHPLGQAPGTMKLCWQAAYERQCSWQR